MDLGSHGPWKWWLLLYQSGCMHGKKSPCSLTNDNFLIKTQIVWPDITVLSTWGGSKIGVDTKLSQSNLSCSLISTFIKNIL